MPNSIVPAELDFREVTVDEVHSILNDVVVVCERLGKMGKRLHIKFDIERGTSMTFEVGKYSDDKLKSYHEMMVEVSLKVEALSPLAVSLWQAVLEELDRRELVKLHFGSYDDMNNALIETLW